MRKLSVILLALFCLSSACCAQTTDLSDNFDGSTIGKATGVTFIDGKQGQAVVLDAPTDSIEYPAKYFPEHAGRIEMDIKLTEALAPDHKTYCLLSDVGAGSAGAGSFILYWHERSKQLQYGIFYAPGWNFCTSKDMEFLPDKWYHLTLTYGPGGMSLEIDGKLQDTKPYTGGLSKTAKKLGYYDGFVQAPPIIIDNFKTSQIIVDHLDLSSRVLCPGGNGLFDTCDISFGVQEKSTVSINIIKDAKNVQQLMNAREMDKGEYQEVWNGKGVSSGIYDVELVIKNTAGEKKLSGKIRVDNRWKRPDTKWTQGDLFPTGVWYYWDNVTPGKLAKNGEPQDAADYYDRTLKDLKEHGVNLIIFCWIPKIHHKLLLDTCLKYGIKAIVNTDDLTATVVNTTPDNRMNLFDIAWNQIKDIKDHPSIFGYYIFDEPGSNHELTVRIQEAKQALEILDPKHPSFLCLLGGYEPTLARVDPEVLLIDIYTLWENSDGNMAGYIGEIERGVRNAGDRPLWIITQGFGKKGSWKIPTPEECRAQAWIALAYGAKGLIHFLYQSTPDGEFLQGMITLDEKPMDGRWSEIANLHADIKKLTPVLLKLKRSDFTIPVKSDKVIARPFTTDDGIKYVIIANKDTKRPVIVKWTAEPAVDVLTNTPTGQAITLQPGGGRLLRLNK